MSLSESLTAVNQSVLDAIAAGDGTITMGLLPLSETAESECIDTVVDFCNGSLDRLLNMMRIYAPAAACYTVASCASQAVTGGRRFWDPVFEKLQIDIDVNQRPKLAEIYEQTCEKLGVVIPDVSDMAWSYISPMMAQASILHAWTERLAHGLKSTLKHHPVPDLEDQTALGRFATILSERIHNNPNLRKILGTEVGGIVANRVISSYVYDRYDELPVHLIKPMRDAFASTGARVTLKSPYVSFSESLGLFEIVLPKQSGKLTNERTQWTIEGIPFSVHSDQRISETEFSSGVVVVKLQYLAGEYPDQEFQLVLGLDQTFRVFEQVSMREKSYKAEKHITLPPGEYMIVMHPEATTNDAEYEDLRGEYKILPGVLLRPGSDALKITHNGTTCNLTSSLKTGIYHVHDKGCFIPVGDNGLLHYGTSFDLQAYIPKNQHKGILKVRISSSDALIHERNVELQPHAEGVYDYSDCMETSLAECVTQLPPGLHKLRLAISTSSSAATRDLWYWKGLDVISDTRGFVCSAEPENIEFKKCKGLKKTSNGCAFATNYHAPEIRIALNSGETLRIPRAGVHAICHDPTDDWTEDLRSGSSLTVNKRDRRIISFRSGGFHNWTLECNNIEFAHLNRTRTKSSLSLASIPVQFGPSGRITAVNETGERINLFSYSSALVAKSIKHKVDHAQGIDVWSTTVATEDLGIVGIELIDYTDAPSEKKPSVIKLNELELEDFIPLDVDVRDGITVRLTQLPAENLRPASLKLSLATNDQQLPGRLLVINIVRKPAGSDTWIPLHCQEKHNTSQQSLIVYNSSDQPNDECSWWKHLWHTSEKKFQPEHKSIYSDLTSDDIRPALETISTLISTKYPTAVYMHKAAYLLTLPHRLATRRALCGHTDATQWWDASVRELTEHAMTRTTPVVRAFLLSSNYPVLAHAWNNEENINLSDPTNIISSFSLLGMVKATGGRVRYAQTHYFIDTHPKELFESFDNWNRVSSGQEHHFGRFNFNAFLQSIMAKVLNHAEQCSTLDKAPVLSARHLLAAITALNKRSRAMWNAAQSDDSEHMLQDRVQTLTVTHRGLEKVIYAINKSIDYQPSNRLTQRTFSEQAETLYYPDLPSLDNPQARQLAELTWAFCVASRATAHGKIPMTKFIQLKDLFTGTSPTHSKNPVNLILTFAPELFAYYSALLDFALYNNPQD
ncbi:hypothetical protein JIN77_02590 [Verrucomicrobiaceae bacterium R5-34]|nr:hypothetical protein [Verrucomicrobiaceae bacterium R5-34]